MATTLNFTKASIDAIVLPATGQRLEFVDTRQACLRLRVSSSGVKTFSVLKRVRGAGMERLTVGRYPDLSIEQARKRAAELVGAIAGGENPAEVRRSLRQDMRLDELFELYGQRHGSKLRSWRDSKQRYRDHLSPSLGRKKISTITREMIDRVLFQMEAQGKANATINRVRALASAIFNRAIKWDLMDGDNPVRRTETRRTIARDRFLEEKELPKFFSALEEEPDWTLRDFFYMALMTGARRGNVLAMRWEDVNLERRIWRIPLTKNGEPQNVTLCERATEILKARLKLAEGPYVFPGRGHKGHLVEPKKAWARLLERSGLQNLRIHDLRRTLGSWQAINGSSLVVIGKSLNHKSIQTTQIYARLSLDPVRESVDGAAQRILEIGGAMAG